MADNGQALSKLGYKKGGRPKGIKTPRPKSFRQQITYELEKALKQYQSGKKDDEAYVRRGMAIRKIMDNVVQEAESKGKDWKWAVDLIFERIEGKAGIRVDDEPVKNAMPEIKIAFVSSRPPKVSANTGQLLIEEQNGTGTVSR